MLSLTKICILIAILLVAMEVRGANVKTPNEDQDIQMMEEEKAATGDSIDEIKENVEDEVEKENNLEDEAVNPEEESNNNPHNNDVEDEAGDEGKNCDCDDKVNKALVNSLATCSQTLSTIENCKVGKVSSISTSKKHVVPCTCNKALTAHLVKSLKSCTQAVETLTKCKKGGEGGGTGKKPVGKVYDVKSCDELRQKYKKEMGTYNLRFGGKTISVYCYMDTLCGVEGGWTNIGHFLVTNTMNCPNSAFKALKKKVHGAQQYFCARKDPAPGCTTVAIPSRGIAYTRVCGLVGASQKGQTGGFYATKSINEAYLDGVSITRIADGKRKHVMSLAAGYSEQASRKKACPCNTGAKGGAPPLFVGNDYYCESGSSNEPDADTIYSNDVLWDRDSYQYLEKGCKKPMMPYFFHKITPKTTNNFELRLCRNIHANEGEVLLQGYEIYVL